MRDTSYESAIIWLMILNLGSVGSKHLRQLFNAATLSWGAVTPAIFLITRSSDWVDNPDRLRLARAFFGLRRGCLDGGAAE